MSVNIHPTAIVSPQAQLGEDVIIGPGAIVHQDVVIGDRTSIGAYAIIDNHTTLGHDNRIFSQAIIGSECQDLKYHGEQTFVRIGNHNTIREFVTINRATGEGNTTVVGDHNLIMTYAHVAHDCQIGSYNIIANSIAMAGHVTIMDHANVGGLCALHQYIRIGSYAMIGGHSRVPKDVPPYTMCAGSPLRVVGINKIGLQRNDYEPEQIKLIERGHRILYRSKLNISQAVKKLEDDYGHERVIQPLIQFVKESERGISK